ERRRDGVSPSRSVQSREPAPSVGKPAAVEFDRGLAVDTALGCSGDPAVDDRLQALLQLCDELCAGCELLSASGIHLRKRLGCDLVELTAAAPGQAPARDAHDRLLVLLAEGLPLVSVDEDSEREAAHGAGDIADVLDVANDPEG